MIVPVQPVGPVRVRVRAELEHDSAAVILAGAPFLYLVAVVVGAALAR